MPDADRIGAANSREQRFGLSLRLIKNKTNRGFGETCNLGFEAARYPLVFLLNEWLQKPILVGIFHLPYWLFLFINNAVSVVLLSLILPWVSRQLTWWLSPAEHDGKRDLAGVLLVIGIYALWLIAFWQYQTWLGRPW